MTRLERGAAIVDYFNDDPRRHHLMHTLLDSGTLVRDGRVSPVDQMIARVCTLTEFAGLVEVEVIAVPDDLANTPFDCWASCEASS